MVNDSLTRIWRLYNIHCLMKRYNREKYFIFNSDKIPKTSRNKLASNQTCLEMHILYENVRKNFAKKHKIR